MKRFAHFILALVLLVGCVGFASCKEEEIDERDRYEIRLYDDDWNEIEEPETVVLHKNDDSKLYNAIAFCDGKEFARFDRLDEGSFMDGNYLQVLINDSVTHGFVPKEIGYYDIRYEIDERSPNIPKNLKCDRYYSVHIEEGPIEVKIYDENGQELLGDEFNVPYDGAEKMFDAKVFINGRESLNYSLEEGVKKVDNISYLQDLTYDMNFWINNSFSTKPKEVGRYDVTYRLTARMNFDYFETTHTRKFKLNIVSPSN